MAKSFYRSLCMIIAAMLRKNPELYPKQLQYRLKKRGIKTDLGTIRTIWKRWHSKSSNGQKIINYRYRNSLSSELQCCNLYSELGNCIDSILMKEKGDKALYIAKGPMSYDQAREMEIFISSLAASQLIKEMKKQRDEEINPLDTSQIIKGVGRPGISNLKIYEMILNSEMRKVVKIKKTKYPGHYLLIGPIYSIFDAQSVDHSLDLLVRVWKNHNIK